ncbi:putative acyl-activating enzyme 6 [Bienertia sinuspersici]
MDHLKARAANSPPLTPLGYLERAATVYDECTSIIYGNTTYTWAETHRRCLQMASSLCFYGIQRGDVVSVLAPNIPASYELHFAVPMCGAILNNLNTRLDPRTISVLIHHGESKLVFVDYQLSSLLFEALALLPPTHPRPHIVLIEELAGIQSHVLDSQYLTTYQDMIKKGDPGFKWVRPQSEWDPIVLNYTSGTTSSPKGVVHSHRGAYIMSMDALIDWSVPKQPVYLWTLPMFHANGWSLTWGMAAVGATNICLRKFDGPTAFAAIKAYHVTHMCGAPIVLNMLSNLSNPPHSPPLLSGVNEVAVVARPDEYWGETPCAFVSLKKGMDDPPKECDVIEYCRLKLPHYMVPKTVVFKDELPKTSTGKIKKFALRDMAKALGPSKISRL